MLVSYKASNPARPGRDNKGGYLLMYARTGYILTHCHLILSTCFRDLNPTSRLKRPFLLPCIVGAGQTSDEIVSW